MPETLPDARTRAQAVRATIRGAAKRYLRGAIDRRRLCETISELLKNPETSAAEEQAAEATARAIAEAVAAIPDAEEHGGASDAATDGTIYTDGSAVPNPGAGGWAAVWVRGEAVYRETCGSELQTTNNRMELQALIAAYGMLPEDASVRIVTDSQLCVDTITKWAAGWRQKGWRRKKGSISNLDLVKKLLELYEAHPRCTLAWTRGHAGDRWNEHADALANQARAEEA